MDYFLAPTDPFLNAPISLDSFEISGLFYGTHSTQDRALPLCSFLVAEVSLPENLSSRLASFPPASYDTTQAISKSNLEQY